MFFDDPMISYKYNSSRNQERKYQKLKVLENFLVKKFQGNKR